MVLINAGRKKHGSSTSRNIYSNNRRQQNATKVVVVLLLCGVPVVIVLLRRLWFKSSSLIIVPFTKRMIGRKDQQRYFDKEQQQQQLRNTDGQQTATKKIDHPELKIDNPQEAESSDFFDATATDILRTLNCHELLASHTATEFNGRFVYGISSSSSSTGPVGSNNTSSQTREFDDAFSPMSMADDFAMNRYASAGVTGAHLFCLAAFPVMTPGSAAIPEDNDETYFWKDRVECNVRSTKGTIPNKQRAILDLWSTARAEITDTSVLISTLQYAVEQDITLAGKRLYVWSAPEDAGLTYTTKMINADYKTQQQMESGLSSPPGGQNSYSALAGLGGTLGPGKLYVDVGSGLGLSAMTVAILYPGTEIVSIEAAPTNWLLQEMNWRCNDFEYAHDAEHNQVYLAGVGISTGTTSQLSKFVWRPTATTSTRAWSLSIQEKDPLKSKYDIDLAVKLRPWHSIESEADIKGRTIDVLHVDCEGCEYNLIPALSQSEYDSIRVIMGQMHWGFIPTMKLPSSRRGKETHERLCRHENFVRTSIECCDFLNLPVHSSYSSELLIADTNQFPPVVSTVKDVAGSLCDSFAQWAIDHNLHTVESDWGWLQGYSMKSRI